MHATDITLVSKTQNLVAVLGLALSFIPDTYASSTLYLLTNYQFFLPLLTTQSIPNSDHHRFSSKPVSGFKCHLSQPTPKKSLHSAMFFPLVGSVTPSARNPSSKVLCTGHGASVPCQLTLVNCLSAVFLIQILSNHCHL